MEQHPVPRQITTFEFKLIGFMTLKQFLYLVVFLPLAYIIIRVFPIPVLNFLLGIIVAAFGLALAFVPINDRPFDVFLRNLYKRITSSTQYVYRKGNEAMDFLDDLPQSTDPQKVSAHLDSQQKLNRYLQQTNQPQPAEEDVFEQRKKSITSVLNSPQKQPEIPTPAVSGKAKPFIVGVVKNNKQMPLPGLLLYIKDQGNTPLRLLKTNPHGIFATYSDLPPGEYNFEIKDPKETFFFDTMKIHLDKTNPQPLEFYSKELL